MGVPREPENGRVGSREVTSHVWLGARVIVLWPGVMMTSPRGWIVRKLPEASQNEKLPTSADESASRIALQTTLTGAAGWLRVTCEEGCGWELVRV